METDSTEEEEVLNYHKILSLLLRAGYKMNVANHLARLICDAETKRRRDKEREAIRSEVKFLLEKHGLKKFWKRSHFW